MANFQQRKNQVNQVKGNKDYEKCLRFLHDFSPFLLLKLPANKVLQSPQSQCECNAYDD
ncbi:MAG: hypothetical protein U9Q69_01270 [Nanoarchaeota archaeon]|nr:hypothetical protein [Nanoarchaeota archaeon]